MTTVTNGVRLAYAESAEQRLDRPIAEGARKSKALVPLHCQPQQQGTRVGVYIRRLLRIRMHPSDMWEHTGRMGL